MIPSKGNSGSSRGSCVHYLLECLINPRHKKKYFEKILQSDSIYKFPALKRFILKHAKKLNVDDTENLNIIEEYILTALNYDFYCDKSISLEAESEFKIEANNYIIKGFIDKKAKYPDGSIRIIDYKSSKAKFSQDELDGNLQWLMYSLATYKQDNVIPEIEFQFLKFKSKPSIKMPAVTESELKGFEVYLQKLGDYLKNFTDKDAISSMAVHDVKKKWLCGSDVAGKWCCEARNPFDYYALYSENGDLVKTAFCESDLKEIVCPNGSIIKLRYNGCPYWANRGNGAMK